MITIYLAKRFKSALAGRGHRRRPLLCISLLFSIYSGAGIASLVNHLYQVSIAVPDRSAASWQKTVQQGLAAVLTKVSGKSTILASDSIRDKLPLASQFVSQYHYTANPAKDTLDQPLILDITYDKKAINYLLQQAGESLWGNQRPLLMVWITKQPNNTTTPQTNTTHAASPRLLSSADLLGQRLQAHLKTRGLPTLFPQQGTLSTINDLSNLSLLNQLSANYNAEALLICQFKQQLDGSWSGNWALKWEGGFMRWHSQHKSIADEDWLPLLSSHLDQAVNTLANYYAASGSNGLKEKLVLTIYGISDLTDYAKLMKYLHNLSIISLIASSDFDANLQAVRLQVDTTGSVLRLRHALENSHQLKPTQQEVATTTERENYSLPMTSHAPNTLPPPPVSLSYRWQPT